MTERLPIFVYGTLRPGQKNYPRYLRGKTLRERSATAPGRLYLMEDDGVYPSLTTEAGTVLGVLVDIRPEDYGEVLRNLDDLEEYDPLDEENSVYLRRKTEVSLKSGERVSAWVYYWNRSVIAGSWIRSGDFTRRG